MSKPSVVPSWATDPGTRLQPSPGELAAGFSAGQKPPARWMGWLWGTLCDWQAYLNLDGTDELTYANTRTRTVMIHPQRGFSTTTAAGANAPSPDDRGWISSDDGGLVAEANSSDVFLHVPFEIPQGAVLTQVRAGVTGSAAGLDMKVFTRAVVKTDGTADTGTTTQRGSTQTATTAGDLLTVSGLSVASTDSLLFHVSFTSNSAGGGQIVHWIEVTYTETRATGSH